MWDNFITKSQSNKGPKRPFFDKINDSDYNSYGLKTLLLSSTAMADIIIPQGGATNPVTPPQDLQINLEDVTEQSEGIPQGGTPKEATVAVTEPTNTQPEPNLDLDLNLPDAPKNDDRLKNEDQKNQETVAPVVEQPTTKTPVREPINETATVEPIAEIPATEIPVIEMPVVETPQVEAPIVIENTIEDIIVPTTVEQTSSEQPTVEQPSTVIETIPSSSFNDLQKSSENNLPQSSDLKEDMAIINDLESHASAGGLAPEANVEVQPAPVTETSKTFDLDAMFGTPPPAPIAENSPDRGRIEEEVGAEAQPTPISIEQTTEIPQMITTPTPVPPPAFVIPTTETQVPVQAVTQVTIPHKKTKSVKTLLFVVLFAALGFTTYFILKTMYPLEFASMFGKDTQMHASEDILAETGMIDELSGTIETLTGEEMTETTEDTSF